MIPAPLHPTEAARMASLHELEILDTAPEQAYDELTRLAAIICETPIALVSFVDHDRQWFKSRQGLDATETPRSVAFCSHAILGDEMLQVHDAREDVRFHDNPLVTGGPRVIFYAGVPLVGLDQQALGTLCVIDSCPRALTAGQQEALETLGRQVVAVLELRRTNRRLVVAAAEAQAANRAKGEFLARMSHEIRTPLNGIIGLTDLMCTADMPADAAVWARQLQGSGKLLLSIVNDVLDVSSIEADALQLVSRPAPVAALVQDCVGLFSATAHVKGLTLTISGPVDAAKVVRIDGTRLQQVINNLISNGIKFTDTGGVDVSWQWSDGRLRVTVRDTGVGVPPAFHDAVFEPFRQLRGTEAECIKGTGLGLSIVRGLCTAMGGTVCCQAAEGGGTKFVVEVDAPSVEPVVEAVAAPAAQRALRVLVAEDNRVNQMVARGMLSSLGHSVTIVGDGHEAVAEVRRAHAASEAYDVILMDMWMPRLHGIQAAEQILAGEAPPPILACTANADPESAEACLAAGMIGVLAKPMTLRTLSEGLSSVPLTSTA